MNKSQPNLNLIIGDYEAFLKGFFGEVKNDGFDLADFVQLDHICYRTVSLENYETKKAEMNSVADLLSEVTINHRSICSYRLRQPILFDNWRIDCLELPAPKANNEYLEGLEHAEFVLYDGMEQFMARYPGKSFDLRAAQRGVNPEIGYKLPSYGVKFHLLSLATAVFLENKLGLTDIH